MASTNPVTVAATSPPMDRPTRLSLKRYVPHASASIEQRLRCLLFDAITSPSNLNQATPHAPAPHFRTDTPRYRAVHRTWFTVINAHTFPNFFRLLRAYGLHEQQPRIGQIGIHIFTARNDSLPEVGSMLRIASHMDILDIQGKKLVAVAENGNTEEIQVWYTKDFPLDFPESLLEGMDFPCISAIFCRHVEASFDDGGSPRSEAETAEILSTGSNPLLHVGYFGWPGSSTRPFSKTPLIR